MRLSVCDMRKINIERDYHRVLPLLSEEKRKEILRYRQEEGRYRALVREVMVSWALEESFPGNRILIGKNEYGKPFIAGMRHPDGTLCDRKEYGDFDFNLSHSGALVALVYGKRRSGIDVERLNRVSDYGKLLRFFSEKEQRQILTSPDPEREFYRVWTFREAFSKEEGIGLSLFEREPVDIDFKKNEVCFHGRWYHFTEYEYPGYQISLCMEHAPGDAAVEETAEVSGDAAGQEAVEGSGDGFLVPELTIVSKNRWEEMCAFQEEKS